MTRTYVDSGVLIAAARGTDAVAAPAMAVLTDPARVFVSSVFVRLEVLPKPLYLKRQAEADFYDAFFAVVADWAPISSELVEEAYRQATALGLSAIDALHLAAAIAVHADELVTAERPEKPIHRATGVKVVPLHPRP